MMSKPASYQRPAAGGRELQRVPAGQDEAAPAPEVRVDQHRHVDLAEGADQSVEAGRVVHVAVAAHDGLDGGRIDVQLAHVAHDTIGAGTRVEEEAMLASALGHRDQHREAVLGDQRAGHLAVRHQRRRTPRAAAHADPAGRAQVRHQLVGDVVHQRGHHHRVDRLQVDLDRAGSTSCRTAAGSPAGLSSVHTAPAARGVYGEADGASVLTCHRLLQACEPAGTATSSRRSSGDLAPRHQASQGHHLPDERGVQANPESSRGVRQIDWSLRCHPDAPATRRHLRLAWLVTADIAS